MAVEKQIFKPDPEKNPIFRQAFETGQIVFIVFYGKSFFALLKDARVINYQVFCA